MEFCEIPLYLETSYQGFSKYVTIDPKEEEDLKSEQIFEFARIEGALIEYCGQDRILICVERRLKVLTLSELESYFGEGKEEQKK